MKNDYTDETKSNTKLRISNKKRDVVDKDNIQKRFTFTKQNNNELTKVLKIIKIYTWKDQLNHF